MRVGGGANEIWACVAFSTMLQNDPVSELILKYSEREVGLCLRGEGPLLGPRPERRPGDAPQGQGEGVPRHQVPAPSVHKASACPSWGLPGDAARRNLKPPPDLGEQLNASGSLQVLVSSLAFDRCGAAQCLSRPQPPSPKPAEGAHPPRGGRSHLVVRLCASVSPTGTGLVVSGRGTRQGLARLRRPHREQRPAGTGLRGDPARQRLWARAGPWRWEEPAPVRQEEVPSRTAPHALQP